MGLVAAATLACVALARLTGLPAPVLTLTPLAGRLAEALQLCAKPGLKLGVIAGLALAAGLVLVA